MEVIVPPRAGQVPVTTPELSQMMLDALQVTQADKVLEIGTGSGFMTWRLAQTGCNLYSIELTPQFLPVDASKGTSLRVGDGSKGLPDAAPFSVIVSTCGVENIPAAWEAQLMDGGRLLVPIGQPEVQRLVLLRKDGFSLRPVKTLCYARFLMMSEVTPRPVKPVYKERPNALE